MWEWHKKEVSKNRKELQNIKEPLSMSNLLGQFLDQLEVSHTRLFVDRLYDEHPHKNNMFGLKKMLDVYGVKTLGVSINSKNLSQLNFPCILHTHNDFVIVQDLGDGMLTYLTHGKQAKATAEDFKKIWTGHALVVEEQTDAQEPDYRKHLREDHIERLKRLSVPVMLALAAFWGIATRFHTFHAFSIVGVTLSIFGILVCSLLLQKQLHGDSRLGDRVCSLLRHADCNSLLDGEKSRVFGVSWSEVGLGYFVATILLLTLYPTSATSVAVVNWIAMCYGIWSVYYQWHVARSWCTLCLAVQVIVWAGGLAAACFAPFLPDIRTFTFSSLVYATIIMVTHYLLASYVSRKERTRAVQQYRALKANEIVAEALIEQGDYYETTQEDSSILFGNPDASLRVTILSNPHCTPCARMHERVERLLSLSSDDLCIQYIFSSFSKELEDSNRYLISLYDKRNTAITFAAYKRWYEEDKFVYREVLKRVGPSVHAEHIEKEMERHRRWCKATGLRETPTILVNGFLLPKELDLEDLAMITNCNIKSKDGRSTKSSATSAR